MTLSQLNRSPTTPTMPVGELIAASSALRAMAEAAIERSRNLGPAVIHTRGVSLRRRLESRAHLWYARLGGTIDGEMVVAVVRTTGEFAADRRLIARAELVVSMGDDFDGGRIAAGLDGDPVTITLTLMRAMDRVDLLDVRLPDRNRVGPDKPSPSGWSSAEDF